MYERVTTSVRIQGRDTDDFPITIKLHQGSTLSPYLFTLVLDVLIEHIQKLSPRCMLFYIWYDYSPTCKIERESGRVKVTLILRKMWKLSVNGLAM